ncbi:DR2241 family protein [Halobacterium wangiae]|uniref:DR2241 family protein n=1 Tax=Halobacterium wangiae TaxID=2902623 RepID=UPI001E47C03E|nr:DR2241 family protein [Halobacterium wangiae]
MSATTTDAVADALVDAANAGIDFDGLTVEPFREAYRWQTPETEAVVSAEELQEYADDPYATNWYYWEREVGGHDTARRAFLRWLEGDDLAPDRYEQLRGGHTRHWGELAITVVLSDGGTRRYEVRHEDDVGEDVDAYTDPLEARHLVKHDNEGRYRPLSTAPSLPHGWAFVDLDGSDLVQTVEYVYPATVANWHREREGDLDVDHWEDAASRQTGIYSIVEQLDGEALEWGAEACCVDSQCLKRREWDENDETELDVPRGDGEFPCREPCSLFVAAARKFVTLEREESREYTFELTPAEKEQIEDIVDTVADGRTDEIREADVYEGANRYRARFLRAKRMDEHGLSGTPTYPEDHD